MSGRFTTLGCLNRLWASISYPLEPLTRIDQKRSNACIYLMDI